MNVRAIALALVAGLVVSSAALAAEPPASRRGVRRRAATRIDGAALYREKCAACHGRKGEGSPMGRPLAAPLMNGETTEAIGDILRTGIEGTPMMSFARTLSAAQIEALATYVAAMKR